MFCSFDEYMASFEGDVVKVWSEMKKEYLRAKMVEPMEVPLRAIEEAVDRAVYGTPRLPPPHTGLHTHSHTHTEKINENKVRIENVI